MKRAINIFALLFIFNAVKAVDTLTTKLINSIYLQVVDPNAKYYYLAETGRNPEFNHNTLEDELINIPDSLKKIPFDDFIQAILSDTAKINWREFNLTRAKCVDKQHYPSYSNNVRIFQYIPYNTNDSVINSLDKKGIIPVLTKNGMSKKQLGNARQIAEKKYEDKPIEEKTLYWFSKPIYSKNKDFVLIQLNKSGSGCLYVFKLTAGKWSKAFQFQCWVS